MGVTDLKAIRARVEKATAGPWEKEATTIWAPEAQATIAGAAELRSSHYVEYSKPELNSPDLKEIFSNADFIAHARQDIPNLLDAFKEALRLLKELNFQFEPLIQDLSEEHYLDDDVEALFVSQLAELEAFLIKHRGKP